MLVNGRRVAISAFAESITTNFVDINSIPVSAIERVEVLKDGASALYGSDAVAGVVNIILRKDFEGLELLPAIGGRPARAATTSRTTPRSGDSVARTSTSRSSSTTSRTARSRTPSVDTLGSANQTARAAKTSAPRVAIPGRFIVNGVNHDRSGVPAGSRVAGQTCVYDYGPWNLLVPEAERSGLMLLAHQDFAGGAQLFAEFAAQHNNSIAQGAPTPLDEGAGLTVPITNPGNPYPGATTIAISRYRTVDAGPRQWDI